MESKKSKKTNKNDFSKKYGELKQEIAKQIVGQEELVQKTLIAFFAGGNILLEGAPGLAKTLLVNTISKVMGLEFSRIQFTPDLLPTDILGTKIFNQKTNDFETKKGPVFANLILADEINRAPPKTQSSLLEAMAEKQISIIGDTYKLDEPFLVLATQNPIEQEGTYNLPEAQIDRFMLKLMVDFPSIEEEIEILNKTTTNEKIELKQILSKKEVLEVQNQIKDIYIDDLVKKYIVTLVDATRNPQKYDLEYTKYIKFGASPRANISLAMCAKSLSFLKGKDFVEPDEIREIFKDALRHRVILTFEAEIDNISINDILDEILEKVESP